MGRKLPWARDTSPSSTRAASPATSKAQPKRGRDISPELTTLLDNPQQNRPVTPRPRTHHGRRTGSRSPSSSPVRPPPEINPMNPGYHADDIYMMVEDEFYSVAQSFTAHLHHAEYKRLKRKAHAQPPQSPPKLSPHTSREIKLKLQRDLLAQKQGKVLNGLGGGAAARISNDDDEVDKAEPRVPDPWRGTSLAGLMGGEAGGIAKKTSLVGLERVPSETRAARGYAPGVRDEANGDLIRRKVKASNSRIDEDESRRLTIEEAAEDDDDIRYQRIKKEKTTTGSTSFAKPEKEVNMRRREHTNVSVTKSARTHGERGGEKSTMKPATRMKRSFIDDFDDYNGPIFDPPSPPAIKSEPTRVSETKAKKNDVKDRKARLAEVPIFMM